MAKKENKPSIDFAFGKENYVLVIIAIAPDLYWICFACQEADQRSCSLGSFYLQFPESPFAPILVIGGFVVAVVAVLKKIEGIIFQLFIDVQTKENHFMSAHFFIL